MANRKLNRGLMIVGAAALAWGVVCDVACGRGVPDYGFQWAAITHPGNRGTTPEETPLLPQPSIGRVDHEYRLSRTEVTVGQWYEFINAYVPYFSGRFNDTDFLGFWIREVRVAPDEPRQFRILDGAENYTADMSWHFAARYANWLCNNKALTRDAFESGAYDTSTFGFDPVTGDRTDQHAHTPGAPFWIPTYDEWNKAVYYDPDRYGPGEEGYWPWPNQSTESPIGGLPSQGGQTSAMTPGLLAGGFPVAQYPAMGPNGLFDVSGGRGEWTESIAVGSAGARLYLGSNAGDADTLVDRLASIRYSESPSSGGWGLRLASAVPSPGCLAMYLAGLGVATTRRRQR